MGLLLECKKKVAIRHHSSPQQALHSTSLHHKILCLGSDLKISLSPPGPSLVVSLSLSLSLLSLKFNPHLTSRPQPLPQLTSQLCSNFLHFYGAINLGRTLLLCGQTDLSLGTLTEVPSTPISPIYQSASLLKLS